MNALILGTWLALQATPSADASTLYAQKHVQEAELLLEQPESPPATAFHLGVIALRRERYPNAVLHFERLLRAHPEDRAGLAGLAYAQQKLQNDANAPAFRHPGDRLLHASAALARHPLALGLSLGTAMLWLLLLGTSRMPQRALWTLGAIWLCLGFFQITPYAFAAQRGCIVLRPPGGWRYGPDASAQAWKRGEKVACPASDPAELQAWGLARI